MPIKPARTLRFGLDATAFGDVERERLFAEDVLARLQSRDDLLGMKRGRRDQEDRVDVALREHHFIIRVEVAHAERFSRPGQLFGERAASSDELSALHALGEILRVAAAEAAQAGDTDAQAGGRAHNSTIRFSRQDVVAASASSRAFTPSSIEVFTGVPLASASKKCAISLA